MIRTPLRAAALLAIAIGGAVLAAVLLNRQTVKWDVTVLAGKPRVGSSSIDQAGALGVGEWIETDSASKARVAVSDIGTLTIEPSSRLRLVRSHETEHRLELARGKIEASIYAPPRLFFVDTPAATAVDLGCRYILTVDKNGSGLLQVTLGWVSFERGGVESIVPHGALCRTDKVKGPGTPYFADASAAFRRALDQWDSGAGGDGSLQTILDEARTRDSLTLWHLLVRVTGDQRGRVFDRLALLAPPPSGVNRDRIMKGDPEALTQWRRDLPWAPYQSLRSP